MIDIPAGRAALGLVTAGEVRVLAIAADGAESELAQAATNASGRFAEREVESDHTGPLRINVGPSDAETSRYLCDLLDGCVDRNDARAAFGEALPLSATLSAALSSESESGTVNITPFTTAAVQRAITLGGLTAANIEQADREMAEALEALVSPILRREIDLENAPSAISIVDLTDAPDRIVENHTDVEWLAAILHASLLALEDGAAENDIFQRFSAAFAESGSLPINDTVAGEETIDAADLLRVATGEVEAWLTDSQRGSHVRRLFGLDNATERALLNRMRDLVATYDAVTDTVGLEQVDSDGDGLPNLNEIRDGLDPRNPDSDGDTVADGRDPFPLDGRRTVRPDEFPPTRNFAALCADPRSGNFPDRQGTFLDENNWLRSWSNDLYLWYDEIVDVDPVLHPTRQYFDLMKTFATTPSGADRDRFHFTYPTDEWEQLSRSGVSASYGASFAILSARPPRDVRVAYVEPDSPASRANLRRGARITTVDDVVDVAYGNAAALNAAFFPSGIGETHRFEVQDRGSTTYRTVSLTSALITSDPVQNDGTIETDSGTVGYMLFNDHIATAERELFDAVTKLADAGVDDLVLDLRYNGGGYLAIASQMAYMIVGSSASGRTFDELRFNDKHRVRNPITGNLLTPTPFFDTSLDFSVAQGRPLPTLNLSRVFVLTGGGTCSASESIMKRTARHRHRGDPDRRDDLRQTVRFLSGRQLRHHVLFHSDPRRERQGFRRLPRRILSPEHGKRGRGFGARLRCSRRLRARARRCRRGAPRGRPRIPPRRQLPRRGRPSINRADGGFDSAAGGGCRRAQIDLAAEPMVKFDKALALTHRNRIMGAMLD